MLKITQIELTLQKVLEKNIHFSYMKVIYKKIKQLKVP